MTSKKILIVMSDTGGGHRSAAEAIAEATHQLYGEACRVEIADPWANHTPFPINRLGQLYGPLVNHSTILWKLIFRSTSNRRGMSILVRIFWPMVRKSLKDFFRQNNPDVIVSVHPVLTYFSIRALQEADLRISFVTVVTDLVSLHPLWLCPETDSCLVPTELARDRALDSGLPLEKVKVVGLPVGSKFAEGVGEKESLRDELGLERDRPTILVVGGGEGIGKVHKIARAIAKARINAQLVVVAGRNKRLRQRLEKVDWEIPTTVFGFVTNMRELMGASDVIVTKAGPSTISEALIIGLPILLSGFIPGQEEGNVEYVMNKGAGTLTEKPQLIAATLAQWLQPENETLTQMAQKAQRLGRPQAALDIAAEIFNLAQARSSSTQSLTLSRP
ncbi:MAG: galactosyldiacylglycerol synthase [Anaerolineales bacterium]|nr:MAG: galactosyldiacylglycerol synthase [Anaerolineales bacterium]